MSSKTGYGRLQIGLHWLVLALIAVTYATMEFKSVYPKGSEGRQWLAGLHYSLGLSVFVLAWIRLLLRAAGEPPVIDPALPPWQARLAQAVHWALYGLMVGLPLLGWLTLSAKGIPVLMFGTELPALIAESKGNAKWLKDIHEALATAGYGLIGLHAAAALYHHYVKRDNTLRMMLVGRND